MTDQSINEDFKPIDIKDVFRSKSPKLTRMIPGFVFRCLHKTLAIDKVNEVLRLHGHKKDFNFANSVIEMFGVTVDVRGKEHLPDGIPLIFVSNHPLGGFDGALILREIGEHYKRKYKVLVNDILMNVKNMDGVFIPINKHGAQAIENVRKIEKIFQSDDQIMTFPAGLVSRRKKGLIRDPEWKKNFVSKAVQHHRDVVTIHISGRCSSSFYTVANIRKFLRIKANIEMFMLPKEAFSHENNHYVITIGKPISYHTFDKRYRPLEWAAKVKDYCYALEADPEAEFDGNKSVS